MNGGGGGDVGQAPMLSRQSLVQTLNVELYRRSEKQFSNDYRNHKFLVVKHNFV